VYQTSRELFDAARAAARDAELCARQLASMEESALSLGGGGFEPRVRSTPDPDRIGAAVSSVVDQGERLRARQDEDYRLIDAACRVLYGADNRSGLYALVGWPADAIYHHYLALRTWEDTAALLGYSVSHVKHMASAAMDLADANGQMWTELGRGLAE
jgi:squalene cyclase